MDNGLIKLIDLLWDWNYGMQVNFLKQSFTNIEHIEMIDVNTKSKTHMRHTVEHFKCLPIWERSDNIPLLLL